MSADRAQLLAQVEQTEPALLGGHLLVLHVKADAAILDLNGEIAADSAQPHRCFGGLRMLQHIEEQLMERLVRDAQHVGIQELPPAVVHHADGQPMAWSLASHPLDRRRQIPVVAEYRRLQVAHQLPGDRQRSSAAP